MRYFKMTGSDGAWPTDHAIQPGTIIRLRSGEPGREAVWNDDARSWVYPLWSEVADPSV